MRGIVNLSFCCIEGIYLEYAIPSDPKKFAIILPKRKDNDLAGKSFNIKDIAVISELPFSVIVFFPDYFSF